jgi:hypothetical protein
MYEEPLQSLELDFLRACYEVTARQKELVPLLAETLQVQPEEVFYEWAQGTCEQIGQIPETNWYYFFHGLECSLKNREDDRGLRVDFGPGGRIDTFTGWGVMQFAMASKPPWRVFPALREHFSYRCSITKNQSGDHGKMTTLENKLLKAGYIKICDPELYAFVHAHRTREMQKVVLTLPDGTHERTRIDCTVCDRLKISNRGQRTLGVAQLK